MSPLTLHADAFAHGDPIPRHYTCEGEDVSPRLTWHDAPPATQSFALIVDDPDAPDPRAPTRVWVHWLRYNLPAAQYELLEGDGNRPPAVGADACTDAGRAGYHGPCPPIGRHRYFFRLFALDAVLPLLGPDGNRVALERAMHGHVLESAVLMGTYEKRGPRRDMAAHSVRDTEGARRSSA